MNCDSTRNSVQGLQSVILLINDTSSSSSSSSSRHAKVQVLNPSQAHCIVFLDKTLYSHSTFLSPGV